MDQRIERIDKAVEYINAQTGNLKPLVGIILGSGLGRLGESIKNPVVIPYSSIPDFPKSTAIGHKGNFILGELGGKTVIAMQGRFHYYEGYPMDLVTIGVRVMKKLGIEFLFASNAAGACNKAFKVGDLVMIKDHINMFPNPLIGPNIDEFGERFPDLTCAYDLELQKKALDIADKEGIVLNKGVYFGSSGPSYETPAEVRFFRMIGADLLGMSTIPEVIVARHCGIRVFGVSVVTNCCNDRNIERNLNDGEDVIVQADIAAEKMTTLFTRMVESL
mgnify:CR=1 FL=1